MSVKELLEKRAVPGKEIKALTDAINTAGRRPTDEERKKLEQWNADYDGLTEQIALAKRAKEIQAEETRLQEPPKPATQPGRPDMDGRDDPLDAEPQSRDAAPLSAETREHYKGLALQAWINYHGPSYADP